MANPGTRPASFGKPPTHCASGEKKQRTTHTEPNQRERGQSQRLPREQDIIARETRRKPSLGGRAHPGCNKKGMKKGKTIGKKGVKQKKMRRNPNP